MPTKTVYTPQDPVWVQCCRAAYIRLVARTAIGCSHPSDIARLSELLREVDLSAMDYERDVEAAREGKAARQWGEILSYIEREEDDLPEGHYPSV